MVKFIKQIRRFITELGMVGIGQISAVIASIVGVRLITEYINPTIYGEINLGLTIVAFSTQLIFGPLANAFLRYFSIANESNDLLGYFSGFFSLTLKSSFLVATIGIILIFVFGNGKYFFYSLLLIYGLATGVSLYIENFQTAARQRKIVAWHQGIGPWLRYMLCIVFIIRFGSSNVSALLGFSVSAIIILISQTFFVYKKIDSYHFSKYLISTNGSFLSTWSKNMLMYSLPFTSWGLFTWAQLVSDRWAIEVFKGVSSVGQYAVLYQLGYFPISFITSVFVQFITPILFQKFGYEKETINGNQTRKITNQIVVGTLIVTVIASLATWILSEQIFMLLTSTDYRGLHYLLPIMILSGGIFSSAQISTLHLLNTKNPNKLIAPKIVTSIIGMALNFIFSYFWGVPGVVFSGFIFSIFFFSWIIFLSNNYKYSMNSSVS